MMVSRGVVGSPASPKTRILRCRYKAASPFSPLLYSSTIFFFFLTPILFSCPLLLLVKLTMTALLWFAILFTCWLLRVAASPKPAERTPKKDGKEVVVRKAAVDKAAVFATFDKDGDGFITAKELEESLKRLGLASTRNEIMSTMGRVDANGDGLIDLEEFGELCDSIGRGGGGEDGDEREEEEEEMELREAFGVFDENGDGLITVEELGLVLASLGLKRGATAADCRDMIRKVDLDGDGMVDFGEFKKMMMKGGKLF